MIPDAPAMIIDAIVISATALVLVLITITSIVLVVCIRMVKNIYKKQGMI